MQELLMVNVKQYTMSLCYSAIVSWKLLFVSMKGVCAHIYKRRTLALYCTSLPHTQTMKGYVVNQWLKGPDELVLSSNVPVPEPKQGELQIQVKAIGLNFFDTLMIQGRYQIKPPFPFIPGGEFSGVVLKSTVPEYKAGDRVFGSGYSFAEVITTAAERVLPVPKNFTFEQAAGLYITWPTSYAALVLRAQLKAGEYCLVHAAAGGVGIAAVQIAKALGAKVIATAGSQDKLDVAKRYGADYAINYRDKDWTAQVKKITNGHGADVVYGKHLLLYKEDMHV